MSFLNKNIKTIYILVPVIAGLLVYLNSLNAPFQYDDYDTIMQNKDIRVLSDIKSIFTHSFFRPVLFLTFAISYKLSGLNPFSYHLFNILLHIINIFLLFCITRRLISHLGDEENAQTAALLVSTLFAVHPIGTEAITYISSRSSVLATFFFFSAFYSYLKIYKTDKKSDIILFYTLTIILFMLGAFSKEIVLTLPLIIVLTDIIVLKLNWKENIKRIFTTHLPFVLIISTGILIRIYFFFTYEKVSGTLPRSVYENLLTQSEVIIKYIRLLLLPFGQNLIHNYPTVRSILNLYTLLSIFTIVILVRFAIIKRKEMPLISFGILWFFITLLPSSSFIPFQEAMTEKHLYLPMAGFFLCISGIIISIIKRSPEYSFHIRASTILIFIILSILTIYRNYLWGDSIRLWEDIIKKTPDSWATHYAYADALRKQAEKEFALSYNSFQQGDQGISQEYMDRYVEHLTKAIKHYIGSTLYRPAYTDALLNAGICYGMLSQITRSEKDISEAERFFRIVREIEPQNFKAINNLANLYLIKGNYESAINLYKEVLNSDPNNINALTNLSQIYLNITKENSKAREILTKLLKIYRHQREFDKIKVIEDILNKIQ